MESIDYEKLRADLNAYKQHHGRGAFVRLAKLAGGKTHYTLITKIATGETQRPEIETWRKLHLAAPDEIRPPTWDDPPVASVRLAGAAGKVARQDTVEVVGVVTGRTVRVPVFDAQGGTGVNWTDGGYPVGQAGAYIEISEQFVDANSFCVKLHGDSMLPTIKSGYILLVVPSHPLAQGEMCFVRFPGEDGDAMIKRYYRYGDTVVLKSDNPAYPDMTVDAGNGDGVRIYAVRGVFFG